MKSQNINNSTKHKQDLQSISTEADSFAELHRRDLLGQAVHNVGTFISKGLQHHEIAGKVAKGTFTADKMCKFSSAILKVMRAYKLGDNLKGCEKLGAQIGQVRRLLRVDRVLMVLKELAAFSKKKKTSLADKLLIVFKLMLLCQDFTDLSAYLMQLNVLGGQSVQKLRKRVQILYFFECLGWFIYYMREYYRSKTEEQRYRNKMSMVKYVLDGLVAHNELGSRLFILQPTTTSILSLLSGSLNLYLVWK